MPAELTLIRHASVDCSSDGWSLLCGRHDIPLSPLGREQVKRLRERLASEPRCAAIYASPLLRTMQTAQAITEHPRTMLSLAEISCGRIEGMRIEDVKRDYAEYWNANEAQTDETFRWPGGETYCRFRHRVLRAMTAIARLHSNERVLIFTHAGVINQVLGSIHGQSAARWGNLRPHNASITRVHWERYSGSVECFDDCTHLDLP